MNCQRMSPSQTAETMGRLTVFNGLPQECLLRLASGARQIWLPRDGELFVKGEPALAMYVVVSGQVKVYLPMANDTEKMVAMVAPGDCLGVAAVYLGEPHPACAVTKADSHLLAIEREVLVRQARLEPGLACRLLAAASRRVIGLMHDMESCISRSSLQRLSCFLLQHRPHPSADIYEFVLPTSKREIAAKLNLAQETLSRAFHQLTEERAIQVEGRLIQVRDCEKLIAINLAG